MAKDLNVSPSYLCKIENGVQQPSEKFIKACANYLNVPVNKLFPEKIDKIEIKKITNNNSNQLWLVRMNKGIKQNHLAKLLGCSPSYLSKVEKEIQKPNIKFKKKCAKILKVKEIELFP